MALLLWTLAGLALFDSLNVFNVGMVLGIVYDSRLNRRSPALGVVCFLGGLFASTMVVGLCLVLGVEAVTDLVDVDITPAVRYRAELVLGAVAMGLAFLPMKGAPAAPGWVFAAMRSRPWLLALTGIGFGLTQAPVSVSYLTGMAMLAAKDPRVAFWPAIVAAYCLLTLLPSLGAFALATRRTVRARRVQTRLVGALTRGGPIVVRIVLLVIGIVLINDAAIHLSLML